MFVFCTFYCKFNDSRMRGEYAMTFKTELERCSQWLKFLERRIENTSEEADDFEGYEKLTEDHVASSAAFSQYILYTFYIYFSSTLKVYLFFYVLIHSKS